MREDAEMLSPPDAGSTERSIEPIQMRPQRALEVRTAIVLIIGRFGSGKTSFIETACSEQQRVTDNTLVQSTREITFHYAAIGKQSYKLIDTPGFDNPAMSNFEAWRRLANHLLNEENLTVPITSVLYLHRAGDPIESRALLQNLDTLFEVFLGDSGLSRLTIVVLPKGYGAQKPASTAQELSHATVFRTAQDKGARIIPSTLGWADVQEVLISCTPHDPSLLHIQARYIHNPKTHIGAQIEEGLGHYEKDSMQRHLAHYRKKVRSLETKLKDKESQVSDFSYAYKETEQQLAESQKEASALRQQYQQTQKEYASLRSQLQLQENVEQGDIVQTLKDLNRSIDDVSRSISEYLVDTHVRAIFDRDPTEITALDANQLPELKELLGHSEGSSSLVASSQGAGMPIEDFFDYAIRFLLCHYLYMRIFTPFHPAAKSSINHTLVAMYDDVQKRGELMFRVWAIAFINN
ncbi:hypothetical protein FRC07_006217 [Ceratobasidium sp. 392]|nr:hypothetical protein FRC07_006217 [Ceratobasidium sp. 392]